MYISLLKSLYMSAKRTLYKSDKWREGWVNVQISDYNNEYCYRVVHINDDMVAKKQETAMTNSEKYQVEDVYPLC